MIARSAVTSGDRGCSAAARLGRSMICTVVGNASTQ
jgi:hypothetical protein